MIRTQSLRITPAILSAIAEIDEFKGAWRALGSLAPERLSGLRRVATIESIGSSTRIEGSKLSDQEVQRLLSNLEIKKCETRDEQEVASYAQVMDVIFASWREKVEREKLMLGSLPEVSARLMDLVRDHGHLTIGDAERLTGENRNTLKQHFRGLVAGDHLALNGAGRGLGRPSFSFFFFSYNALVKNR